MPPENTVPPEDYSQFRPLMFSIAYRMTGSISDAEDIVQEAFLRLTRVLRDGTSIEAPKAYLATATTRLAISHLRSARVRRESYVGAWLPEPLLTGGEPDPAERAEMSDSLSMAFLVLMESLTPTERAVFLLHEVFGYGYQEIADITGKSEPNCRQILARARHHVDEQKPRYQTSRARSDEVARRFFEAAGGGDLAALLELLAPDVTMVGDGGGKAWAAAQADQRAAPGGPVYARAGAPGTEDGGQRRADLGQRPAGGDHPRRRRARHQRVRPRHRRWPGADDQVRDQPRQAAPPGPGL